MPVCENLPIQIPSGLEKMEPSLPPPPQTHTLYSSVCRLVEMLLHTHSLYSDEFCPDIIQSQLHLLSLRVSPAMSLAGLVLSLHQLVLGLVQEVRGLLLHTGYFCHVVILNYQLLFQQGAARKRSNGITHQRKSSPNELLTSFSSSWPPHP